ncbi:putative protein N(5)-glutamine methyltransferase [Nocardia sp. NPDC003345]
MTAFDTDAVAGRLRAAGCVFAEEEAQLLATAARTEAELIGLVEQRVSGIPLEYLLGWAEFKGIRVAVRRGVFVPRQRSALLVDEAMALAARRAPRTVVDLCCGSGALGLALLTASATGPAPPPDLFAADIDPVAVGCARENLAPVGGRVFEGDLFDPLPATLRHRVDILLANTPYVPTGQIARMPPEARDHEPPAALDGGPDGLDLARRTVAAAPAWLAPGGSLLIEIGADQITETTALLAAAGLDPRIARSGDRAATVAIGTISGR